MVKQKINILPPHKTLINSLKVISSLKESSSRLFSVEALIIKKLLFFSSAIAELKNSNFLIMSASTENSLEDDSFKDEITLRELISVLWGGRILIFCFTTVVAIASIIISLSITNVYTSESVLAKTDSEV